jgi:hypothetical protein
VAYGQSNVVLLNYQWAVTNATNTSLAIYLDEDFNPFNGNERLVSSTVIAATGSNQVGTLNLPLEWNAANATPGVHSVFARIGTAGRTRYLYTPERITIHSSFQAPSLAISSTIPGTVTVDIIGVAGQRIFLQGSSNLSQWQTISTNWLSSGRASYIDNQPAAKRFYRAYVQ